MKFFHILPAWVFGLSLPVFAGLKFDQPKQELTAEPDAKVIKATFAFSNDGDAPLTIEKMDAGCSCVSTATGGDKKTFAPGEKGSLEANFTVANFSGIAEKQIGVWLKGDPEDKPSTMLILQVKIPVLIVAEPMTLFWDVGEAPEPKTIHLKVDYADPIHITGVTGSNANYTQELKTIEDGRKYELVITPKVTSKVDIAVFSLSTDCKVERQKEKRVFCSVRRPVPGAPQTGASKP